MSALNSNIKHGEPRDPTTSELAVLLLPVVSLCERMRAVDVCYPRRVPHNVDDSTQFTF